MKKKKIPLVVLKRFSQSLASKSTKSAHMGQKMVALKINGIIKSEEFYDNIKSAERVANKFTIKKLLTKK